MLKKTIEYVDYNGVERKEDFYFNLNKAELMEMELGISGGMAETLQKIIDTKDQASMVQIFKDLICKSYGEKSPDGKRFMKSEEITAGFIATEAYPILYMELATNADAAAAFVNGIMPADITKEIEKRGGAQAVLAAGL